MTTTFDIERHNPLSESYDPFDDDQHGNGGYCECRYCIADHMNRGGFESCDVCGASDDDDFVPCMGCGGHDDHNGECQR